MGGTLFGAYDFLTVFLGTVSLLIEPMTRLNLANFYRGVLICGGLHTQIVNCLDSRHQRW